MNELVRYMYQLDNWDGTERLDTLLIDYLGAEDTLYTRRVTRKAFMACVARVIDPGVEFNHMLVIAGEQGIGKSMLLNIMSKGRHTNSVVNLAEPGAIRQISDSWIIEIEEISTLFSFKMIMLQEFVNTQLDSIRPLYGSRGEAKDVKRRCVFFGTTNSMTFLRTAKEDGFFWPVRAKKGNATKNVFEDLQKEVDQIWAEALEGYVQGETLK